MKYKIYIPSTIVILLLVGYALRPQSLWREEGVREPVSIVLPETVLPYQQAALFGIEPRKNKLIQPLPQESDVQNELVSLKFGRIQLNIELADSEYAQTKGLTNRASLPKNQAMLYIITKRQEFSYWAKDMKFATDIIWIGPDFTIVDITENVTPDSYPQEYRPKEPARYVIEANAGTAKRAGIKAGDNVDIAKMLK